MKVHCSYIPTPARSVAATGSIFPDATPLVGFGPRSGRVVTVADLLAAALRYAAAGIAVFPVKVSIVGGKKDVRPIHKWRENSTTSPEMISRWWGTGSEWERASIAIDTGKSRLVVVDPDGQDGLDNWGKLVAEHGLPVTWRVATPGGGEHWYYAENPTRVVGNDSNGKVAEHVDVRGLGGFVFAAPSTDARGAYRWLEGEPEWSDLPVVPDLVADRMNPRKPAASGAAPTPQQDQFTDPGRTFTDKEAVDFCKPVIQALREAPNGQINHRLNNAAMVVGHFVPEFWSRADAERWLLDALSNTVYDGKTWKPEPTIESGISAADWKAVRIEPRATESAESDLVEVTGTTGAVDVSEEGYAARFAAAVLSERLRRDARRAVDAEEHARNWTAPEDHGNLAEELEIPDSDPTWRLDGLLGAGHNAIIVASRKAGKTTTINNLIKSYVDGGPFLGRFPVTPTNATVGIFNYEVDARQYRHWLRDTGISNAHRVFVLHLRGRSLPLKDPRVRAWVADWLRQRGVGLWIVDPYSRAYVGSVDDGNGEAQVGAFLDTLDVIKAQAGVSELVMPVHTPKARAEAGEETAIGSQRLEAWPDSMWYLTRDAVTGSRFLRAEGRDVDVPEQQLSYNPANRGLTLGGGNRAEVRGHAEGRAFLDYLAKNPGATTNDIARALECGTNKVGQIKTATQGLWRTEDGPRKSKLHYLTDLSVDHTALTAPEQLSTTTALLSIESSSSAVAGGGELRSSGGGTVGPCTVCGKACDQHSPGDWGPCTRCGSRHHRYGPGGRALCDACHQESTAA